MIVMKWKVQQETVFLSFEFLVLITCSGNPVPGKKTLAVFEYHSRCKNLQGGNSKKYEKNTMFELVVKLVGCMHYWL